MPKRRLKSITELNAIEQLYGSTLTPARIMRMISTFEIITIAFSYLLYMSIPITIVWVLLTALGVYAAIIPRHVQNDYYNKAMNERNKFINLITQGLSTKNANVLNVLTRNIDNLSGEFGNDMRVLTARLLSETEDEQKRKAFKEVSDKYHDDIYFDLFIEQLETAYYETQYNIETFETFKESHNTVLSKMREFQAVKKVHQKQLFVVTGIVWVLLAITAWSVLRSFDRYMLSYAHSIAGYIASTLFFIAMFIVYNKFYRMYYDDEVTSI